MSLSTAELDRMAEDTGCSEHDDCLTCPLPECIYDTNMGAMRSRTAKKQANIKRLHKYHTVEEIANQLGICVRTVQRALKE